MKGLWVLAIIGLLAFLMHQALYRIGGELAVDDASEEFIAFDGMFGMKFSEPPDERLEKLHEDDVLILYRFVPSTQYRPFDNYMVAVKKSLGAIVTIIGRKEFVDIEDMGGELAQLLPKLRRQYGVAPVRLAKNDIVVMSAMSTATIVNDVWWGMTFRGPSNGKDKFIGICCGKDAGTGKFLLIVFATDFNLAGFGG